MKRIFMLLTLILALMCPALASAEVSSDKMILDWTTSKAVSYTHLDVYKRQISLLMVILILLSMAMV